MVPPYSVDDTLPHAMNLLCITAYTAARLTTWLALRNAQTNIGRRLRLGLEPGRQCPIRLTEGDLIDPGEICGKEPNSVKK